jgi:hypothetical protein
MKANLSLELPGPLLHVVLSSLLIARVCSRLWAPQWARRPA